MPNQSGKIVLVLVLIILLLGAAVYFFLPVFNKQEYIEQIPSPSAQFSESPNETPYPPQSQKFNSEKMKFSMDKNPKFYIEEDTTFVNIYYVSKKINISRIATNFPDLQGYLEDFDKKRKLSVNEEKNINVNGLKGIERTEVFNGGPIQEQRVIYVITQDGWVYTISTSDEALYPVLDQIVQSFEYKP